MDITNDLKLATSTPQDAAQNINGANFFDISPIDFKMSKETYQSAIDEVMTPPVTPHVARYVAQSPEHASVAKPDLEKLSDMEKIINYAKDQIGPRRTKTKRLAELGLKKMFYTDTFTDDDDTEMVILNEEMKQFSDYGTSSDQRLIGDVAGAITSMGASLWKHADLIAAGTALGAGIGATGGAAIGGVGAIPGAVAGAGTGAVNSSIAAFVIDGVNDQMGLVYNELENTPDAQGKVIDHETRKNVAIGVGVTTGAITAVVGKTVAKTLPFLNRFLSPQLAAKLVTSPTGAAITKTLFNIGKSVGAGAAGGGLARATEIFGREFAKNYDGTEESFLNALTAAGEALGTEENLKEIKATAVVGGLTTGTISTVAGAAGFKTTKAGFKKRMDAAEESAFKGAKDVTPEPAKQIKEPRTSDLVPDIGDDGGPLPPVSPKDKAIQTLHLDQTFDALVKVANTTEMNKLAPGELNKFLQGALAQHGIREVYVDQDDVLNWAGNDPKKTEMLANIIDPEGRLAEGLKTPIKVEAFQWFKAVKEYPELGDLVKSAPEGMTASKAAKFVQNLVDADKKRVEVTTKMGVADLAPEERTKLEGELKTLTEPTDVITDIDGESDYLDMTRLNEAMKSLVPEKEASKYSDAQYQARVKVVETIDEAARYEMDKVKDIEFEFMREAEFEAQLQRLENSPNLKIVENFKSNYSLDKQVWLPSDKEGGRSLTLGEIQLPHRKEGFSPYAIDPRTLPEDLKHYANNAQLKKHKVFVKGGIDANQSARLLGLQNGEQLLKVLSETPDRQAIAAERTKAREADIKKNLDESVDINKVAHIEALNSHLANAHQTLMFMKDKQWPAMRGGIKRIALRPPTIAEIEVRARDRVAKMRIGDLTPNVYKVGERKSHRLAVDAILKNMPEQAFEAQMKVVENIAMAKYIYMAIGKINRAGRFVRRLETAENKQNLKDAGPLYVNAIAEIADVFNLNLKYKNSSEVGAFQKWAKKMYESGEANFEVPERLNDIRESAQDMTVEQYLTFTDRMKSILHTAKMKNRLYKKHEALKIIQTQEAIATEVNTKLTVHPDYDPKKAVLNQSESKTTVERASEGLLDGASVLDRAEALVLKLDNEQVSGMFNELFIKPIKEGEAAKGRDMIAVAKQFTKAIEEYGEKDFAKLNSTIIQVPEFENIKTLPGGKITKGELLVMMANIGNSGNKKRLENFGVSYEVVHKVLERELDHKDMKFVQEGIWNIFESFKPRIAELQKKTEGVEQRFVEAEPVIFKDRVYPGGYFPIRYQGGVSIKRIREKLAGRLEVNRLDKLTQNMYSQAMTETGRLEERTGSDNVLSLSLRDIGHGFEEVVHDLNLRAPLRDTYRLLSNAKIANDISSVIGVRGYNNLADMVVEGADSMTMRTHNDADVQVWKYLNHLNQGFQSVAIVGKLSSIMVQPASIPFAIDKMGGAKGAKHLAKVVAKMALNPTQFGHWVDLAAEIHPSILEARENIDKYAANAINRLMPINKVSVKGVNVTPLFRGIELVNNIGYGALGWVDQYNKTVVVLGAMSQALNGDAPGIPANNFEAAKAYAQSIARLTQTHGGVTDISPIQRSQLAKPFLFFYNDANNVYQSYLAAGRKTKYRVRESFAKTKEGDYTGAGKAAAAGVAGVMGFMLIVGASKLWEATIRGQDTPFSEMVDVKPSGDIIVKYDDKFMQKAAEFYMQSPVDRFFESIPLARDTKFASGKYWMKKKTVDLPLDKMLGDFAGALNALGNMLDMNPKTKVTDQEMKQLLLSTGYIAKFPAETVYNWFIKPDFSKLAKKTENVIETNLKKIRKFVDANKGNPDVDQQFVQQLEEIEQNLTPQTVSVDSKVPGQLKQMLSGGKWNAFDPETGAAGIYQFTETVWNNIKEQAPELGLTDNGRVAENPEQQEKAMNWLLKENARILSESKIPVTPDNLYAAHILGAFKAVQVLEASGDTKIKTFVSPELMNAYKLPNSMKVRDFKDWLLIKATEAEMQAEATIDKSAN